MKGSIEFEIPACCIDQNGRVKCPLAWNTNFCSMHSPKGLKMTGGDWEEIYQSGRRPDFCPIKPMKESKGDQL